MINAGKANSRLHFDDGVLYLNLSGGDQCHHVKKNRETIIQFVCNSSLGSSDLGKPVFISENDCTYYIVWHTSLACERQVCTKSLKVSMSDCFSSKIEALNSPYWLSYISFNVSCENLAIHQPLEL